LNTCRERRAGKGLEKRKEICIGGKERISDRRERRKYYSERRK
jgi:hypothetical protein